MLIPIWLAASCAKQPDDSRYFQPWTCSSADGVADDLDADGDGEVTELDLVPGESAVQFRWLEPERSSPVVVSRRLDSILQVNPFLGPSGELRQPGDGPVWGIWHRIACEQEASLFLWFPGVAVPAQIPVTSVRLDIPSLEQGGPGGPNDDIELPTDLRVLLTETTSAHLSGHLVGTVDITVHSNITGESMGQVIRVEGYAFNQVAW